LAPSKFLIYLIIVVQAIWPDKTGTPKPEKAQIYITFQGFAYDTAQGCLKTINRNRKRPLAISEGGDGDYQIIAERRQPGLSLRIEKMGATLKSARTLYDYEVCIAAATLVRDTVSDD